MSVLVTGASGYIGSNVLMFLRKSGIKATGTYHRNKKDGLVEINSLEEKFEAVVHCGASINASGNEIQYIKDNVDALEKAAQRVEYGGVLIFLSSAMVGAPNSAYGKMKQICEEHCRRFIRRNVSVVVLRPFNVCGVGFNSATESKLFVPFLISKIMQNEPFKLNGNDFDTVDGTCVRDYVHVLDVCETVFKVLSPNPDYFLLTFDVCSGKGITNLELIKAIEVETKRKAIYEIGPRREGDPASLIGDNSIMLKLSGYPKLKSLKEIIHSYF